MKAIWQLLKESYDEWSQDRPFQLSAALAYYTFFSLAPLLLLVIGLASFVFGKEAAQGQIVGALQAFIGQESARAIQEMIRNASQRESGVLATALGVFALLLGAGGVVGQLQVSLNTIWGVMIRPGRGLRGLIIDRFLSFAMVLGIGFLLVVSLIVSTTLSAVFNYLGGLLTVAAAFWHGAELVVSLLTITLLFAFIYKLLPDVRIAWKDAMLGAALTSALFSIGKFLIGFYLGRWGVTSTYGAAGSLIAVLLWVNYSALIFFFGAEFTQVYANKYGRGVKPSEKAMLVREAATG